MTQGTARPRRAATGTALAAGAAVLLAGLAACSDDSKAGALEPVSPSTEASAATTTPSPTATPTPATTATPLSRFEADPGVQGIRVNLAALSTALNARNMQLPAYLAATTAKRQQQSAQQLRNNRGGYLPGPTPFTPLVVRDVSTTEKAVSGCILSEGWTLNRKGGTPLRARKVEPAEITVLRQGGVWKVDTVLPTDQVSCAGVRPVEQRS